MRGRAHRFVTAVRMLVELERLRDHAAPAVFLASRAGTDAGVIHRIARALGREGLVTIRPGPGGGVALASAPSAIDLRMVSRAVGTSDPFGLRVSTPRPRDELGRDMLQVLADSLTPTREALDTALERITIADLAAGTRRRERIRHVEIARHRRELARLRTPTG